MSANVANVKVVPSRVLWNGTDLGLTEGDLDVKITEKSVAITAHQEGSNELDAIRTGKMVSLTLKLQETSDAQLKAAILNGGGGSSGGVAQIQTVTCIADVSGSLNDKFFPLVAKSGAKFLVWLNVNSAGHAPALPGYTAVEVDVATGATASAVATAVAAAIDALADFVSGAVGTLVTVTDVNQGFVASGLTAGNTGFTVAVTTAGVSQLTGFGKNKDFSSLLADSAKLVLHPVTAADTDYTTDLAMWKAYPEIGSIKLSGEHPRTVDITFKIFPDTSKPDGVRLFAYGDHT
jgi:hypothetical protein